MSIDRSFLGRNTSKLLLLFISIIILIFGFLLFSSFSKQDESRQAAIINLSELMLLDQKIQGSFSYEFQAVNNDTTIHNNLAINKVLERLFSLILPQVDDGDAAAILVQLESIQHTVKEREHLLEKHKSHKAVALNSMRFIPGYYAQMKQFLEAGKYDLAYKKELSNATSDLISYIFYSLFSDTESDTAFNRIVSRLEDLKGHYAGIDTYITYLVIHAKSIANEKQIIRSNLAKNNALGLHAKIEQLNSMYIAYLDRLFVKNKNLNLFLYGTVILLLIFLAIVLYKEQLFKKRLEELNVTLESRVETETAKRLENEQILMQQSKLNAMGELITSISHQWRQPLNALGIIIQDIEDAFGFGELSEKYLQESVESSMEHINSMSKTIDEFRKFFSRSEAKSAVDVYKSVEYALQMLDYRLTGNQITVALEADEHYVYNALGLKSEFEQIVMIILNNAIDALIEKQKKGTEGFKPHIHITMQKSDKIVLSIEDNGIGIDKAVASRMFEPYFTTKEQGEGIGMGLYIAKIMLENHMDGTLHYDENGTETRFIITLGSI